MAIALARFAIVDWADSITRPIESGIRWANSRTEAANSLRPPARGSRWALRLGSTVPPAPFDSTVTSPGVRFGSESDISSLLCQGRRASGRLRVWRRSPLGGASGRRHSLPVAAREWYKSLPELEIES